MAKTYKATVGFRVWKQHKCVGCQRNYSYLMSREVVGEGASESAAESAAAQQIQKTLESEVDYRPCPSCGVVQPEMLASRKAGFYLGAVALGILGIGLALILGLTKAVVISTSAWIAVASLAASFLLLARGACFNGNRDLQGNQSRAEEEITKGLLRRDDDSTEKTMPREYEESGLGGAQMIALALWIAALGAVAAPLALKMSGGWVPNAHWYPAIIGPGDESTVYFDRKITSLNGMWHGFVNVSVANANAIGLGNANLSATTKDSNWGDSISGRSVSNSTNRMWATVQFPANEEDLVGKDLVLDLKVTATFPFEMAGGFMDKQSEFTHTTKVTLSKKGAGTLYRKSWWIGQLAAIGGILVAVIIAFAGNHSLAAKGNPTQIFFPEAPDDDQRGEPSASGEPPPQGFSTFEKRDDESG